jgi:hypothetical protein
MGQFQRFQLLFALFALLVFMGCKGRKNTTDDSNLRGMDKEKAIAQHLASQPQFKVLTLKGKANFEDRNQDQKVGFSYRIDIAKDSLILLTVSKFGIPGMNMLLSPDSVRMRLPMNNTASVCDYSLLEKMAGMDFDLIRFQDYILGNAPLAEPIALTSGKANPIMLEGNRPPYSMSWILNSRHFRLEKVALKDPILGKESAVSYADFEKVDGRMIASSIVLEATRPQNVRIELHHTSIDFDKEKVDFRFRIPASYQMVPCDQMAARKP